MKRANKIFMGIYLAIAMLGSMAVTIALFVHEQWVFGAGFTAITALVGIIIHQVVTTPEEPKELDTSSWEPVSPELKAVFDELDKYEEEFEF